MLYYLCYIPYYKKAWPAVGNTIRADVHFCDPELAVLFNTRALSISILFVDSWKSAWETKVYSKEFYLSRCIGWI